MRFCTLNYAPIALFLTLLAVGCGQPGVPPLVEVEGTVTINDQPLPHATVTFIPVGKELSSRAIASGVSDAQGRFKLTCAGKPGTPVGEHKVTVTEGPEPENLRDEGQQAAQRAYLAGLKNRPIPRDYGNLASTPLTQKIETSVKDVRIELKREANR